jgi:hypothetical protein
MVRVCSLSGAAAWLVIPACEETTIQVPAPVMCTGLALLTVSVGNTDHYE